MILCFFWNENFNFLCLVLFFCKGKRGYSMSQADFGLITDLFFLEKNLETNKKQKQSKNKT